MNPGFSSTARRPSARALSKSPCRKYGIISAVSKKKVCGSCGERVLSSLDLLDRRLVMTEVTVGKTQETPSQRQVRVQRERTLMQGTCLLGPFVQEAADMTDQRQRTSVTRIKRDSPFRKLARAQRRGNRILCPGLPDEEKMPIGPPRMRCCTTRLHGYRGLKQFAGCMKSGGLKAIDRGNGAQREIECGRQSGLIGDAAFAFAKQ